MHELNQTPAITADVKQMNAQLEHEHSKSASTEKQLSCSDMVPETRVYLVKQRKKFYEAGGIYKELSAPQLKQKPTVPRKPYRSSQDKFSSASSGDENSKGIFAMNAKRLSDDNLLTPTSSRITLQSFTKRHKTKVERVAAFYDSLIEGGELVTFMRSANGPSIKRHSSLTSFASDGSWTDFQTRSPQYSETESSNSECSLNYNKKMGDDGCSDEKTLVADGSYESDETLTALEKASISKQQSLHSNSVKALEGSNLFEENAARYQPPAVMEGPSTETNPNFGRLRAKSSMQNREVINAPLLCSSVRATSMPENGAYHRPNSSCCISGVSSGASSCDSLLTDVAYNTGCAQEDQRLKKLHYAAVEIYTVEKKFVEQLELIAVKYPAFLVKYGKECGIDLLKPMINGHPHLISQIALQLLMVKEAHKVLLEQISSKIVNWDSRHPTMAECFKNGAGYLKYCLPYLKEKKKHVDDLIKLLQNNEELSRATAKFEEEVMGKISIIQQLDIVHQNVVRYTILLEAYGKYLLPESTESEVCKEALMELSRVSESVDRQISLAEMEKRLIDLYRRLEGRINVFEANRHLLFEGELMKQSRKDLQPRYLILFSDVLLICKYSRTPSLGTDANFQSDFYKFLVSRIRVKAEEHGEYETHFQLYTTQKSAVFIAKTKRERDDWVKHISEAKMEAKDRRCKAVRTKGLNIWVLHKEAPVEEATSDVKIPVVGSDRDISPTYILASEKYTPLWIPDPKATSCMMSGCSTKFSVLNRRHHCRECGFLICRACVGYAPVRTGNQYVRTKVCPECYVKIAKNCLSNIRSANCFMLVRFGRSDFGTTIFSAPENEFLTKTNVLNRNAEGVVSGTVFVRNQKGGENEKWGRLMSHADGILVLCFYDAEFDADPVARYVLFGFTISVQELDDGGRFFELRHANQVNDRNALSIQFRVAHSGNAERWYKLLEEGLGSGCIALNYKS